MLDRRNQGAGGCLTEVGGVVYWCCVCSFCDCCFVIVGNLAPLDGALFPPLHLLHFPHICLDTRQILPQTHPQTVVVAGVGAGVAVLTFMMGGDGRAGGHSCCSRICKRCRHRCGHLRLRSEYWRHYRSSRIRTAGIIIHNNKSWLIGWYFGRCCSIRWEIMAIVARHVIFRPNRKNRFFPSTSM